jgi:hypothetical protein
MSRRLRGAAVELAGNALMCVEGCGGVVHLHFEQRSERKTKKEKSKKRHLQI